MIQPRSLQQRLAIYLILPVALLLIVIGFIGFFYARDVLLAQWQEASVLKLQRAAHQVDMRLRKTKDLIQLFHQAPIFQLEGVLPFWVVEQLEQQDGVARVRLVWEEKSSNRPGDNDIQPRFAPPMRGNGGHRLGTGRSMRMRRFHSGRIKEITPPKYDASAEHQTIAIISNLNDENGNAVGRLEVLLNFNILIENVVASGWWQSQKAFILDDVGNILATTVTDRLGKLGDTNDPLEKATLKALSSKPFGTIPGEGRPPKEVSGFSKLREAPWSLVMIAPGTEILAPIINFRKYYFIFGAAVIVFIVLLIRFVTWRTVTDIKKVSTAADKLARGDYGKPLEVKTNDEVGELTRNFNTMVHQLEERMQMKEAMNLAMEVQQNLLPRTKPVIEGLDIAGKSVYCDETGGDFFDFLKGYRNRTDHISVAVGDVSGHGISAALLMATVRALLRSRIAQSGNIAEIITDVNRAIAEDTQETGHFMTLFFVDIDLNERIMRWVRAGHDPAFLYDPEPDEIKELQGKGIALGIDGDFVYQDMALSGISGGQILLIGTDGLWEATNKNGEMFGKERLKQIILKHKDASSEEIIDFIIASLEKYTDQPKQEDDVTLVVVKFSESTTIPSVPRDGMNST